MSETPEMSKDWNKRARKDAFYYICSTRSDWDSESFFRSGEEDYQRLVAPLLAQLGFNPQEKSMLEVGCGVGRVTRAFAQRFGRVYALDISEEMLKRGRALHADIGNIVWLLGDGVGFSSLATESVDFVFSYLVLQHVPAEALALGYIREALRVLKFGGFYYVQFNSQPHSNWNWKGRWIWGLIDRLGERLRKAGADSNPSRAAERVVSVLGLDTLATGKTWRGAALPVRRVLETIFGSGGAVWEITGWGTGATWVYGCKTALRPPREGLGSAG